MLFHPAQLGLAHLDKATLEADKKACKKIGPCGVGKKALYLNSFYIDRRYYLPYGSISMSQELRRLQQLRHFSAMYLSMKESSIRLEL